MLAPWKSSSALLYESSCSPLDNWVVVAEIEDRSAAWCLAVAAAAEEVAASVERFVDSLARVAVNSACSARSRA